MGFSRRSKWRNIMIGTQRHRFNYSQLTSQAVTVINSHSGTTTVSKKKFTNPNIGTNFGSCFIVNGGSGTITIRGCYFGPSAGESIQIYGGFNGTLTIENCLFANNKNGIFLEDCTLANLKVRWNQCINPHGAPIGKGQFIQFSNSIAANGQIYGNKIHGFRGESYTEDMISVYGGSGGTSGNPLVISKNFGWATSPSDSGGGFICGDTGGSHTTIENNKILNPGNYTYAIAGGTNNKLQNNLGYSNISVGSFISCYCYGTVPAGRPCSDQTVQGNNVFISNSNYYYGGGGAEVCTSVTGISGGSSDGNFTPGNTTGLSLSGLDFPASLIDMVDERTLWLIRKDAQAFYFSGGGGFNSNFSHPTANSEADKSTSSTSTTINSTGSSGGSVYRWVFEKGPVVPTLTNETTATLSVSNMTALGPYRFRLEYSDSDGASDADWTTITKT
jgi:hypothetical protein